MARRSGSGGRWSLDKGEEKCRRATPAFSACRKPLCRVLNFSGSLRARYSHSSAGAGQLPPPRTQGQPSKTRTGPRLRELRAFLIISDEATPSWRRCSNGYCGSAGKTFTSTSITTMRILYRDKSQAFQPASYRRAHARSNATPTEKIRKGSVVSVTSAIGFLLAIWPIRQVHHDRCRGASDDHPLKRLRLRCIDLHVR
jgi:hypothetical protein